MHDSSVDPPKIDQKYDINAVISTMLQYSTKNSPPPETMTNYDTLPIRM